MNVVAKHRNLRMSAQKVRLVLPLVKGKPALEASELLTLLPQKAALPLAKAIKSAVANAEHNYSIDSKRLYVSSLTADEGPALKRFVPASRGRAHGIKRRTTHLTVVLTDAGRTVDQVTDTRRNKAAKSVVTAASKTKTAAKPAAASAKAPAKSAKTAAKPSSRSKQPKVAAQGTDATPDVAKNATQASEVKDQARTRAEVKRVAPRKSGAQTGRGGSKGKGA